MPQWTEVSDSEKVGNKHCQGTWRPRTGPGLTAMTLTFLCLRFCAPSPHLSLLSTLAVQRREPVLRESI